jgi:hypothetical protein
VGISWGQVLTITAAIVLAAVVLTVAGKVI